jgi:hypothetical protein
MDLGIFQGPNFIEFGKSNYPTGTFSNRQMSDYKSGFKISVIGIHRLPFIYPTCIVIDRKPTSWSNRHGIMHQVSIIDSIDSGEELRRRETTQSGVRRGKY